MSASDASATLADVVATRSLSLEVWLRPSAADLRSGKLRPVLAVGRRALGAEGASIKVGGCFDGQYTLLLSQRGAQLEVELLERASHGTPTCFVAEAFGASSAQQLTLSVPCQIFIPNLHA